MLAVGCINPLWEKKITRNRHQLLRVTGLTVRCASTHRFRVFGVFGVARQGNTLGVMVILACVALCGSRCNRINSPCVVRIQDAVPVKDALRIDCQTGKAIYWQRLTIEELVFKNIDEQ